MSRKHDVGTARKVCEGFYDDLAIMDTTFNSRVRQAAENRKMVIGGKPTTMFKYVDSRARSNPDPMGTMVLSRTGVTLKGIEQTAKRVNEKRMAVCDQCAQTVIYFCHENHFSGPLEWIGIPYTGTAGHSIVVAHRDQGSDLHGSEESWGNYFIIDLWYYCLGMRQQAVYEKPIERSAYYQADIERHRDKLKLNFYLPGKKKKSRAKVTQQRGRRCLLSTAACNALGLPDDCPELRLLRQFRDGVMADSAEDRRDVDRYYAMAPAALAAIEQRPDAEAVLRRLYWQAVRPAVSAIETGRHDDVRSILRRLLDDPMWLERA